MTEGDHILFSGLAIDVAHAKIYASSRGVYRASFDNYSGAEVARYNLDGSGRDFLGDGGGFAASVFDVVINPTTNTAYWYQYVPSLFQGNPDKHQVYGIIPIPAQPRSFTSAPN